MIHTDGLPESPVDDLVRCQRLAVANSYRRLADDAMRAAEQYSDGLLPDDETIAYRRVVGRLDSVEHARVIYDAVKRGRATGQRRGAA